MPSKETILVNHLLEPPDRISGISRYLFALLEELIASSNYRYALATTWSADRLPAAIRQACIDVVTLPFHKSTPRNIIYQMTALPRLMKTFDAALEFNCNPIGCFSKRWHRVITVHDLYYDVMPLNYRRRHRIWWRLFFPRSLAAASAILCVSRNTRGDVNRYHPGFGQKTIVVHEAGTLDADAPAQVLPFPVLAPYAIYVGNISPNKNPEVLVQALKILEDRGRPVTVYHVGGDGEGLLADAQERHQLANPIRATGALSDGQLVSAYRQATCFVNTSVYEGFCLPVLEAQTFGLPVICADIAVLREVAGDGALFFPASDARALAGHLSDVVNDADLRRRLSETSLRNLACFSWSRAAAETEAIFDRILANGRGPMRRKKK
jgi:glycosyltransferase involved in cell wall biosynthesis